MKHALLLAFCLLSPVAMAAKCDVRPGAPIVLNDASPCLKAEEYRKSVEVEALAGSREAASLLADYYMYGAGDNEASAVHWLRVYVKNGGEAPIILGQILLSSQNRTDADEGEEILRTRAKRGDKKAAEILADHLSATGNRREARMWYEDAALGGSSTAMEKLGDSLLARDDVASKYLGVMWTLVAANQFADGTFKNNQLMQKARSKASQSSLSMTVIENYALAITKALRGKSKEDPQS